jgi:hypothetical protein
MPGNPQDSTHDEGLSDTPALVNLRIGSGKAGVVASVPRTKAIIRMAAEWMYVLRNRSRWSGDSDMRDQIGKRAVVDLGKLSVSAANLRRMIEAETRHIEVEFVTESAGRAVTLNMLDAASSFPWEFVLSAATRTLGRSRSIVITRFIGAPIQASHNPPHSYLFVESAPGRLEDVYTFESELARLRSATGDDLSSGPTSKWRRSRSQTLPELASRVLDARPGVIHVSGIDNHQAASVLPGFYGEAGPRELTKGQPPDGMILRGELPEQPTPYEEIAKTIVPNGAGFQAPALVTLNLYYSGARLARECASRGAGAVIGFLDEIDDEIAEFFFQAFYLAWRDIGFSEEIPLAFGNTWRKLRKQRHTLYGTGIAVWLSRSAFDKRQSAFRPTTDIAETPVIELPSQQQRDAARRRPMSEVLRVDLEVPEEVNYSLLHNNRRLLDALTLTKLVDHTLDDVSVHVQLNVGEGSAPFLHTAPLITDPQLPLADEVRLPLTASLLRSPRERVQTTLYVKVMWDGRVACETTKPVTLLPVDEWFDDTVNNPWLPSFILPRDPAISKIVSRARGHLITLMDDPNASFDGYQTVEADSSDGGESVDLQVQAIWTALVQEYKLLYLNPPPAYTYRNQRLRTPSEILHTRSGTCIDLALLLASCLEYIDIYPVVVLLSGHAFVGYWRTNSAHNEFCLVERVPRNATIEVGAYSALSAIPLVDSYAWRAAPPQYSEIRSYLVGERLRFLEATGLCFSYSFADALDEGAANLRSRDDFDSLLDIALARRAEPPVTPLPMIFAAPSDGEGR